MALLNILHQRKTKDESIKEGKIDGVIRKGTESERKIKKEVNGLTEKLRSKSSHVDSFIS